MTIAYIGHGYVGLVTAAVFADLGNTVWVVGRSEDKIEKLKRGKLLFYEPGLAELVQRNIGAGRLHFTVNYKEAIVPSSVIFICVGTPSSTSGEADLTSVYKAAESIAKHLVGYKVIVTKSTVPPGTGRKVAEIIEKNKPEGSSFAIASAPEFLREGTAISDTLHPDRVIIGTTSDRARKILLELHKPINGKSVLCNVETAELIKYASNALLSTKISFANAMAFLSENVGADVEDVLEGVGMDKRIGRSFLYPGVGYGGSCFPKDVKALIAIAQLHDYDFSLLKAVDEVNQQAARHFVRKIVGHFGKKLRGKTIAMLGLAFKPNTDDMREAPSIYIAGDLIRRGARVVAYDPVAMENAKRMLPKEVLYARDAYAAADGADAVAVVTEWNEFIQLDLVRLAKGMNDLVLFDGRNIYDPQRVKALGFMYYGIGRM
ncbi:UDP-glucose/GDP-mannose dehydrogenase family protein [Patescibacteria group bacterium]|nr:UDP-glucose/GDP-mannose dehydrogenase family protein [Patescibacteria group bacterium]MBU1472735.1 UDP-glucose/GDP-mannose dehydrogenase family protein [Patescibacteria group bacterium]MBU2460002.1 UDP-glucose/GDP-mannose dehydrogenase family protein [Patescibacteria group bacterium]MBU2544340.1 UDP-glucose/GDP-mannose dehydrogenase family protein [Patescibacteria group bacterium]